MNLDRIRALVEDIQAILASAQEPREAELSALANQHEQAAQQARERLEQVDNLLRKGLRQEAIELAEVEPPLTSLVTMLDFPELDLWNGTLDEFGFSEVRELPVDIIHDLNDAYVASGNVGKLLKRFRLQALTHAPLLDRLTTLRRIAARDPDNDMWPEDVRNFERQRIVEIKDLFKQHKSSDPELLAALHEELQSDVWSVSFRRT